MPQGKTRINVVWFKCTDLRIHDHAPLKAAHEGKLDVLHIYIFDPFWHAGRTRIMGYPKTGAIRNRFQIEAIQDLKLNLAAKGHELNICVNMSTAHCFEMLCQEFDINNVFAFHEICSEELRIERQVRNVLRKNGDAHLRLFWGFELYHVDDLSFNPKQPKGAFNSYTAFRKRAEENSRPRPSSQEDPTWTRAHCSIKWDKAADCLPTVETIMGSTYDKSLDPGED